MQTFTHLDFLQITENEKFIKDSFSTEKKEKSPKQETINNILNYSKALSVRKSKNIDFIEMVLN